jgi:hypothetical protein
VEHALDLYGLSFIGEKHNPMYDAYNTLRIYLSFLNEPIKSDFIMLKQFIFEEVPHEMEQMNVKLNEYLRQDLQVLIEELNEIYKMKDAIKIIKRTRRMVEKYENVLINRSGLFSQENVFYVALLIDFYHDLLLSYDEHLKHSSNIMILDESMIRSLNQLSLKRG